ncbi:SMI1/KNR4 family protein [Streptomyces xanthophaeus]|uniref:SMI1/KNR4 family protein n=1 Tax=Streptomyces xanthophaeus TaxID=67385 RepID=UPI000566C9E0|nr:SMI1/KNR4 family protein [Streptomyces xanthophaeus]
MADSVQKILALVGWSSLSLEVSWKELEEELETTLPGDYKELCEAFGRGVFCGHVVIASSSGGDDLALLDDLFYLQDEMETNPHLPEAFAPYGLFRAGSDGLIPWGRTLNEESFFWLAGQPDPSAWPVVVRTDDGIWSTFHMSTSEFLFKTLSDAYEEFGVAPGSGLRYEPAQRLPEG